MGIQWKDEFSVNVEEIDKQHMQLFDILDRLGKAIRLGRDKRELALLLGDFIFYTDRHFFSEETYMRRINFPEIDEHCERHEKVKERVKEIREEYNKGNYVITLELYDLISTWIMTHVIVEDQKYAEYARQRKS